MSISLNYYVDLFQASYEILFAEYLNQSYPSSEKKSINKTSSDSLSGDKISSDRLVGKKAATDKLANDIVSTDKVSGKNKTTDKVSKEKCFEKQVPLTADAMKAVISSQDTQGCAIT